MHIVGIFLGWPSLLMAAGLAGIGAWQRRPNPVWAALLFSAPMAVYVFGSPVTPLIGAIPIAALTITAVSCAKDARWLTWLSLGVYYAFLLGLAILVAMD